MLPLLATMVPVGALTARYSTVVPTHISELMPVFLNPHLNAEWNDRMSSQTFLNCPVHGKIVHQKYSLPWPLKSRELVMACTHSFHKTAVTSTCHSADSALAPVTAEAVRMEILESNWRFEAVSGERTRIYLDLTISEKFAVGIPSFVTRFVQDNSLKESVNNFLKATKRLALPPDPSYVAWARTRQQARDALARARLVVHDMDDSPGGGVPSASVVALLVLGLGVAVGAARRHLQQRRPVSQRPSSPRTPLKWPLRSFKLRSFKWDLAFSQSMLRVLRQRRSARRASRELRRVRHRLSRMSLKVPTSTTKLGCDAIGLAPSRVCSLSQGIDRLCIDQCGLDYDRYATKSTDEILCVADEMVAESLLTGKRSLSANELAPSRRKPVTQ